MRFYLGSDQVASWVLIVLGGIEAGWLFIQKESFNDFVSTKMNIPVACSIGLSHVNISKDSIFALF